MNLIISIYPLNDNDKYSQRIALYVQLVVVGVWLVYTSYYGYTLGTYCMIVH